MPKLTVVKRTNSTIPIEIHYLAEFPKAVPKLVKLYQEEWELYYGPDGPRIAEADIWECYQINSMPLALIAIDRDGEVVGTGALKTESIGSELCQGPWIAALVVEKNKRGNGIGTTLISALEMKALRFRCVSLYASTDKAAEGILLSRGWKELRQTSSLQGPITTYRTELRL